MYDKEVRREGITPERREEQKGRGYGHSSWGMIERKRKGERRNEGPGARERKRRKGDRRPRRERQDEGRRGEARGKGEERRDSTTKKITHVGTRGSLALLLHLPRRECAREKKEEQRPQALNARTFWWLHKKSPVFPSVRPCVQLLTRPVHRVEVSFSPQTTTTTKLPSSLHPFPPATDRFTGQKPGSRAKKRREKGEWSGGEGGAPGVEGP
mmetsp:Transcript_45235/g.73671  ORF Transcript_45235/g.73671 Transcript_45235/m.73671 type:complete len:212 (-) Transcript_45235:940-1575(-)